MCLVEIVFGIMEQTWGCGANT